MKERRTGLLCVPTLIRFLVWEPAWTLCPCRAVSEYGMNHLGLQRIFLRTNPDNKRAIRVYEKSGFREFDRTDDHVYMEILR